jgi:transcriptional regulator with XRE-family HTH domain
VRYEPTRSTFALWDSQEETTITGRDGHHSWARPARRSPYPGRRADRRGQARQSDSPVTDLPGSLAREPNVARVTGPIGPRRNIAATLKRLREKNEKLLTDVANDLLISTSKLSRLENAQGKPQLRDIRDLIRYYGIEGTPEAERLRRWVAAADRPGWWTEYDDDVLGDVDEHLAYEAEAAVLRVYTLAFLPALLHTREYARALIQNTEPRSADYARASFEDTEDSSEDNVQELVDLRMERQKVLSNRDGLDPLQLVAVVHESALRQSVGSAEILGNQLDALVERSKASNVRLHILPFSADPVFTMTCMYAYFEYQDSGGLAQDVVQLETPIGFIRIDNPQRVADYRKWHDALVEASLSADASRDLIRSIRDDMSGERRTNVM